MRDFCKEIAGIIIFWPLLLVIYLWCALDTVKDILVDFFAT